MIKQNISLKNYNTFGIDVKTKSFVSIKSEKDLLEILDLIKDHSFRILGGGSNILLTKDFNGLTILMQNKGINILSESKSQIIVEAQAGENWHKLVLWALERDYGGIENLAFIPGSVGAAPIQNIGAYGVELKSVFHSCKVLDLETSSLKTFDKEACEFGYRTSIFKNSLKEKIIITSIKLKLQKKPHQTQTSYGSIQNEIKKRPLNIQNIAKTIISIRKSKLPDPKEIGNCGSFFKNPVITIQHFEKLLKTFPEIPHYTDKKNKVKVPAGWLIEKLGFKGKRYGNVGVHEKQALVLINYGQAKGKEVLELASKIQAQVLKVFMIKLEVEVTLM